MSVYFLKKRYKFENRKEVSGLPLVKDLSYKFYYHRRLSAVLIIIPRPFKNTIFICANGSKRFYSIRPNFPSELDLHLEFGGEYKDEIVCFYDYGRQGLVVDKTGRNQRMIPIPHDVDIRKHLKHVTNNRDFRMSSGKRCLVFSDNIIISITGLPTSKGVSILRDIHYLLYAIHDDIWSFRITYVRRIYTLYRYSLPKSSEYRAFSSKWADNHDFLLIMPLTADYQKLGLIRFLKDHNFTEFTMTVLGTIPLAGVEILTENIIVLPSQMFGRIVKMVYMVNQHCPDTRRIKTPLHQSDIYELLHINNTNFDMFIDGQGQLIAWPNLFANSKLARIYSLS
jgi:hypothetical protein